jgi:hypothetical protein
MIGGNSKYPSIQATAGTFFDDWKVTGKKMSLIEREHYGISHFHITAACITFGRVVVAAYGIER